MWNQIERGAGGLCYSPEHRAATAAPPEETDARELAAALAAIPRGRWVLSAAHEERRLGLLLERVQQVGDEPPTVAIAVAKGHPVLPLISESRRFGLAQLGPSDRTSVRRFSERAEPAAEPFLGVDTVSTPLRGLAIPRTSVAHLACELVCHIDVESDHDLFVGRVVGAGRGGGEPTVLHGDG